MVSWVFNQILQKRIVLGLLDGLTGVLMGFYKGYRMDVLPQLIIYKKSKLGMLIIPFCGLSVWFSCGIIWGVARRSWAERPS